MNFLFDGNFRPTIEFQPIDLAIQAPNVPSRGPVGFPSVLPLSTRTSKGGQIFHSWCRSLVLKQRYIKELFLPASGLVVELYRNNLFSTDDPGLIRTPFAFCEISLQESERRLLEEHQEGICLNDLSFRRIDLQQAKLPKLRLAMRLAPRSSTPVVLTPKEIKKLHTLNEIELMIGKLSTFECSCGNNGNNASS